MTFVLRPLCEGSDAGNPRNEDRFGYTDTAAWLLDGATALGPSRFGHITEAEWLVDQVTRYFNTAFMHDNEQPTYAILSNLIHEIRLSYEAPPPSLRHILPSSGMALIRLSGPKIEITTLADVKAYCVDIDGGVKTFGGGMIEALDAQALSAFRVAQTKQATPDLLAAREAVAPLLKANRALMNQSGGYFVLAPDHACLTGLESHEVEAAQLKYILLASDGFYDLWETYDLRPFKDVLRCLIEGDGETLLNELRSAEKADPQATLYPRFKLHDDATWLLLELSEI